MLCRKTFLSVMLGLSVCGSLVRGQILSGESVVHDPSRNRYLASDQAGGTIWAVDYQGNMEVFAAFPPAVKGLMIRNDTLFACASTSGLVLFDLDDGGTVVRVTFPGMVDLNDVVGDTSGNIYVSDAQGSQVFRLHLSDLTTELILGNFPWANGMVFDAVHNRILICQWINGSPITAINLNDNSTGVVRNDGLYRLDGLAWDAAGNLLVSSQGNGNIYVYGSAFSSPARMVLDLPNGSADIAFNYRDTILAIPNTATGQLVFVPMYDRDGDTFYEGEDNCPRVPNPGQEDSDGDGTGDPCDICSLDPENDADGDGICGDLDNCPGLHNPGQEDVDSDGVGDPCDACIDMDHDGYGDVGYPGNTCETDNCPTVSNPDQSDTDGDGIGNACCCVRRGDVTGDGSIGVSDLTGVVAYLFRGGVEAGCPAHSDINGDGSVGVSDLTHLVAFLFRNGAAPAHCA